MLAETIGTNLSSWLRRSNPSGTAIREFWIPRTRERVDVALIDEMSMTAYEIKTRRDTVARLPRQAAAFSQVFDTCHAVVDEKHLDAAREIVPDWWGLIQIVSEDAFEAVRAASPSPATDDEILVRLLWRDEAAATLRAAGFEFDEGSTRHVLWRMLLDEVPFDQLREMIRNALINRDWSNAKLRTRRFSSPLASEAGQ